MKEQNAYSFLLAVKEHLGLQQPIIISTYLYNIIFFSNDWINSKLTIGRNVYVIAWLSMPGVTCPLPYVSWDWLQLPQQSSKDRYR